MTTLFETLADEWAHFHEHNPQVWRLFERFALEAVEHGAKRIGARLVWERMRWHTRVETNDRTYKLNNNWIAFYSRKFLQEHPEHPELFETRNHGKPAPVVPKQGEFWE